MKAYQVPLAYKASPGRILSSVRLLDLIIKLHNFSYVVVITQYLNCRRCVSLPADSRNNKKKTCFEAKEKKTHSGVNNMVS